MTIPCGKVIVDAAMRSAVNLRSAKIPSSLIQSSSALFSAYGGAKQTLPDLPYDYNALEPAISTETMTLHHTKHHNTYVTNLNVALEKMDAAISSSDVSGLIALQGALKFNGGGHLNHSLFWQNLAPAGASSAPSAGTALDAAIASSFGSLDVMKADLTAKSVAIQGSGWGWLGYNPSTKRLEVATCVNQDPLQATTGLVPLLGIDVWEHAYYVDYRNVRPDYVKAVWNIVNWDVVAERLAVATK